MPREQLLADAMELVIDECIRRTYEHTVRRLRDLAETDPKPYVLIRAEWLPFIPGDPEDGEEKHYELWSNRLENRTESPFSPAWLRTPSYVVRTRLTTEHITTEGLAQYDMSRRFQGVLLAKVLGWDDERTVLNLSPVVVVG